MSCRISNSRRRGRGQAVVFLAGCALSALVLGAFQLADHSLRRPNSLRHPTAKAGAVSAVDDATQTIFHSRDAPIVEKQPRSKSVHDSNDVAALPSANASNATAKLAVNTTSAARVPSVALPMIAVAGTADAFDEEGLITAQALAGRYPNRAEALHVLALLQAQIRHSAEADKLWRRCVELAPGDDIYLTNLAANAVNRGDSEGAIEVLSQIVAKGNASADAMHNFAASLMNVGRVEEALEVIEDATQRATNSPAHWLLLGQIQLKLGEVEAAESSIRKAIAIGGETPTACFNLASALARQDKPEEAAKFRERYNSLSKKEPISADNRYQVLSEAESRRNLITVLVEGGAIYGKTGDTLKAETLLLRALALDPREHSAASALADLYVAAEMFAEERVARRRLVELNPNDFEAYIRLAKSCVNAGEPEAGAAVLKSVLAFAPNRVDVYASLAQLHLGNREPHKALYYAQEAVIREPSIEGYRFVASVWRTLGNSTEAAAAEAQLEALDSAKP